MTFSRRPGARFNRGRISAGTTAPPNQLMFAGDSIVMGFNSTSTNGVRRDVAFYSANNGLAIDFVGSKGPTGSTPPAWDRDHCAQSGAGSSTILSNILADIGTGGRNRIRLLILDMGINDVANTGTAGTVAAAAVFANLKTIQNALMVYHPQAQIVFWTLMPVQPTTTGDTEIVPFNDAFTAAGGYVDQWNNNGAWGSALYPNNKILIFDAFTAIGGVWDTTLYGGDRLHPAQPGFDLLNPAMVTLLRTSSIVTLRGIKNSINGLSCSITAPAASEEVAYSVAYSITGTVSRAKQDVTVTVKRGSTTLGTATVDQYAGTWTYSWTPDPGDAGAQTINATVTDNVDSSTANATGVAITVVAPANYGTPEGIITSVPILRHWIADSGVTVATGVSHWVDRINSGDAAQGTAGSQPTYTASDATLNNLGSIYGGAAKWLNDAALNLPAPGTTNIWIHFVFKQRTFTAGRLLFAAPGPNYYVKQLVSSPNLYGYNGTISAAITTATLNTWRRGELYFSNSTSDYLKIGATSVTGTNLGNTDPVAGFAIFSSGSGLNLIDADIACIIITQGKPTGAEITALDAALTTYYASAVAV